MLKTTKLSLFLTIIIMFISVLEGHTQVTQAKAKVVIMKTNRAIGVAHRTVMTTKKFTGKLAQSVRHARFAKKMYEKADFDKSAQHSLYARKLAAEVMKENNAKTGSDYLFSTDENAILGTSPSNEDLVTEAKNDDPISINDENLKAGSLNIDVK